MKKKDIIRENYLTENYFQMSTKKDYSEDQNSLFHSEQIKKTQDDLKNKFGMKFMESHQDVSPELINKFLENVQHFEEAFQKAENKKVIEILKYPKFRNVDELTSTNISEEIEKVLDEYAKHNIYIDVIEKDDVSHEDFYKFLTQELTQHEMDFIDIEGFNSNFIYEEFHPSDKLDAKDAIEYLLNGLPANDKKNIELYLCRKEMQFNEKRMLLSEFIKSMNRLIPKKVTGRQIIFIDFKFGELNTVKVDFTIDFEELIQRNSKQNRTTLHLIFGLQKCEFGGFEIISCSNILE